MDKVQIADSVLNQYYPIHSILSRNDELNSIILSDGTTKLLDLLLVLSNCDELSKFLQNLANVDTTLPLDSPFWPGCTVLHLAVLMTEKTKLWKELFTQPHLQQEIDIFLEIDNLTTENKFEYRKRIDVCLERGCCVSMINADGKTPIHLAFELQKKDIVDLLLSKCKINIDYPNDLSLFHIACTTGNMKVVDRLINKGADVNSQTRISYQWLGYPTHNRKPDIICIPVNSTALHIAAVFQNETIVYLLLKFGADIYAQNSLGLTPIHLSMVSHKKSYLKDVKDTARLLLKKASNLNESSDNNGISYLHIAAYADDADAIKKLLKMKINIDTVFKVPASELSYLANFSNRTPLDIAILMYSNNAIGILVESGADISKRSPEIRTPLQALIDKFCLFDANAKTWRYIANKLKCDQRFNEAIDDNGVTLLHVACFMHDFKWAEELLKKGADVNAQILDDYDEIYNRKGWTPMHSLIDKIFYKWNRQAGIKFVKLLMEYGADILAINHDGQSPLLLAHSTACVRFYENDYTIDRVDESEMLSIADMFLESQPSYKINPADRNGFSHFHYACVRNHVEIVKRFLDNGIDINQAANVIFGEQDGTNFTALHFAIFERRLEVAYLLIERGADVNAANEEGETPLHIAIKIGLVDFDLIVTLLSYGADINACTYDSDTPISYLVAWNDITHEQLKFFRTHGSSIHIAIDDDHDEGLIGRAMKKAKPCDRELIFEEFMNFSDVKNAVKNNCNLIEHIVAVWQHDSLTLNFYLNTIQRFIDMGYHLDWQNEKGETPLHQAAKNSNLEAIEALLLLGANVNIITKSNKPPIGISHVKGNRHFRIESMLAAHVWKMKYVGLKVHELCEAAMLRFTENSPLNEDLKRRCNEELASLSKENIGESSNIRSFIYEWGAVIDYPTMSFIQRENIDRFFANSTDLQKNFPELAGLLMMQYRKAVARANMYKTAISLLPHVIRFNLPYLCLEDVLKYFDNNDLKHFIEGHMDFITHVASK